MKRFYFGLSFFLISFTTFAQGTNDNTQDFMANEAWKAACNFMRRSFGKTDAVKDVVTFDTLGATALYAFNFEDGGYVLTSGNKKSDPILAYSQTGSFLPEDSIDNENLLEFLNACKYEVMKSEKNGLRSSSLATNEKWNIWLTNEYYPSSYTDVNEINEISNLLYLPSINAAIEWAQKGCDGEINTLTYKNDTWTQTNNNLHGISYNIMMPPVDGCREHAVAGCVPTALAQVMRKWEWPNSVSYTYKGEQYESTYNWDSMPARLSVNSSINSSKEISTLLRDCGYMLDVNYKCSGTGVAFERIYDLLVRPGLINYNAYGNIYTDEYSKRYSRDDSDTYSISEWTGLVLTELIAGRPVILASATDYNAHSYIISGFQKKEDGYYFYVNFGWGDSSDGYYNMDFTTNYYMKENRKAALIGFSPQKENESHLHDIYAECTRSTIGEVGRLSFYVENANSYILKIKYLKKDTYGYSENGRTGDKRCFYRDEMKETIIERSHGNIFDNFIEVWHDKNTKLENTYTTKCDEISAPTMYEITFLNNYGQVVTYEGTFTEEEKQSTDVNNRESDDNVIIYPNPSSGLFKVRSIKNDFDRITIYDILGNAVKNINIQGKRNFDLDLSDYPTGCYYISISGNDSYIVKQIIKK